jgi:hypothetical protein
MRCLRSRADVLDLDLYQRSQLLPKHPNVRWTLLPAPTLFFRRLRDLSESAFKLCLHHLQDARIRGKSHSANTNITT